MKIQSFFYEKVYLHDLRHVCYDIPIGSKKRLFKIAENGPVLEYIGNQSYELQLNYICRIYDADDIANNAIETLNDRVIIWPLDEYETPKEWPYK